MKKIKRFTPFAIGALCLVLIVIFAVVSGLKAAEVFFDDETTQNYFVTIWSAVLGGLCTLVGVIITVTVDSAVNKKKKKEDNKPELFVPGRYDSKEAIKVVMERKRVTGSPGSLYEIVLKNSDKAPVLVERIVAKRMVYLPKTVFYIEKNNLFCLVFNSKQTIESFQLAVKSVDDCEYLYDIRVKNRDVWIEEVKKDVGD